ncbi:MAG: ATPase, T2SS/T4P/T4SS family [Myxococcales bacterium]|nr:ATPase, T2SS/T4P/T4SS family [Myxococcales bacterium]
MFSIVITERGGAQRTLGFDDNEITIGRVEGNDIVLPKNNVSKRHARVVLKDDRYILIDLKSTNGTYVNGRKISAPMVVSPSDKIYIGDFILALTEAPRRVPPQPRVTKSVASARPPEREPLDEPGLGAPGGGFDRPSAPAPPPVPSAAQEALPTERPPPPEPRTKTISKPPPASVAPPRATFDKMPPAQTRPARPSSPPPRPSPAPGRRASMPPRVEDPESGAGPATSPAVLAPSVRLQGALHTLMERLATAMDVTLAKEQAFPSEHQRTLEALIDELENDGVIGPDLDRRFLTEAAISEAVGLGPLDRLLNNRSVREVVVDTPSRILADLGGGLSAVSSFFSSRDAVRIVARRLLARADMELGEEAVQRAQLPGGTQVQVLMPPLSPQGPLISVRCPPQMPASADGLVTEGVLSTDMLSLLRAAMKRRLNVLVVGPASGGVSTLLSALSSQSQDHERIVALQDSPSLAIDHPQVLSLDAAAMPGAGVAELLEHVGRLRPDRLVIDDLRGRDALRVLMHAATQRGVLVGLHAPSPVAALEQLELHAQLALGQAELALAPVLARAFELIVQITAAPDGARRVVSIDQVRGGDGSKLDLRGLYRYERGFKPTEHRAGFLSD